jgi:hypothetical protein
MKKAMEDMQKAMEVKTSELERKASKLEQVVEDERKKASKLEKVVEDERKKASKLEKVVEDERKKASKLENVVEDERKKASKLENVVEDERKKTGKLEEKSRWLERQLDAVKETADDTTEWIMAGVCFSTPSFFSLLSYSQCLDDSEALRRIKLRTLLDRTQAKLAFYIGLTTQPYTRMASEHWRNALDGSTTSQRLASARTILETALSTHPEPIKSSLIKFMDSAEAMEMVVEPKSKLRERGDEAAHYKLTKPQFTAIIEEYCQKGGERGDGLKAFVNFLFP